MIRVMVADSSEHVRANLERRLAAEADMGVVGTAVDGEQALQEALRLVPDIAVIDANLPGMDGVQTTEMMAEYAAHAGVILMSMESGSDLFRRAMLAGAREVLQKPFTGDDLVAAIHRVHSFQVRKAAAAPRTVTSHSDASAPDADAVRRREGRMITVVSGKGGVGKSVIATNVALLLNRPRPGSVVLIDLSLQFGDVAAMLDVTVEGSIAQLAADDAVADREVIQQSLTTGPQGLIVLAAPASPELADYVTTAHLRALTAELRATYESVVADSTSQLSEITLEALESSDHIVLVTDFSVTSVKNTRLIMSVIGVLRVDPDRIVVVANHRDAPASGGLDRARMEDFLKHPVAVEIPHDAAGVGGSVTRGVPIAIGSSGSPVTAALEHLAAILTGTGEREGALSGGTPRKRSRRLFSRD